MTNLTRTAVFQSFTEEQCGSAGRLLLWDSDKVLLFLLVLACYASEDKSFPTLASFLSNLK